MPRNNGSARKIQRKQRVELRMIEANESGISSLDREVARGFTSGKRLTPYLAGRYLTSLPARGGAE